MQPQSAGQPKEPTMNGVGDVSRKFYISRQENVQTLSSWQPAAERKPDVHFVSMESKSRRTSSSHHHHHHHQRSRKPSAEQEQEQPPVELALRSRGAGSAEPGSGSSNIEASDAVPVASADAVRHREDPEAIRYNHPHSHPEEQEMESRRLESNILDQQHYDLNPVGHFSHHRPSGQFRQPVSELPPAVASQQTRNKAVPGQAGSVITNLTRTIPADSPPSRITNPGRVHEQPFLSQQRQAGNYQYSHHPSHSIPGSASHDAMYASPFSGVPYITNQFPDQALPGSEAISKFSDHSMEILSAVQYDEGAALAVERSKTGGQGQKHRSAQLQGQRPVFGLTGHFELPGNQVTGRSRTQSSKSGTAEMAGGERRRKKQKLSDDEEEQDESTKKARGRPRLDTKDETAADRRRTQIRMAQRAYRHRKETTIATLEKQVQELRGTNEEMNSIFISLYDFAVGKGLLQREPEFGQHLQSSTQRFLALARSISNDDQNREDDSAGGEGGFHGQSDQDIDTMPQPQDPRPTQAWGYQLEDSNYAEPPPQSEQPQYHDQPISLPNRHQNHQIISRATTDNASFSFDMLDNMQQYRAEIPDLADNPQFFLNYQDIPLPKSLAHKEVSFARILQRAAVEGGYKLISSPNPNPARLNEVFGFCLRFASKESIKKRLHDVVFSGSKDSLYAWREPFVHIGGSGTFYPIHEHGISGDLQPKFRTGMSMGPFSASVMETKEKDFFDDFHTNVPGFEGDFFDANDVEGYLRGQGIEIPPNADYINLSLDLLPAYDVPSINSTIDTIQDSCYSPQTPRSPISHLRGLRSRASFESLPEQLPPPVMGNLPSQPQDIDLSSSLNWANPFDPLDPSITQGPNNDDKTANMNPFDLEGPIFNSLPPLQLTISTESVGSSRQQRQGDERYVTVAVSVLIEELVRRCVCLGRAPGFRPADVDAAIRRAIRASL